MTTTVQGILSNLHSAVHHRLAPEELLSTLTSLKEKLVASYRCQRFLCDAGALRLCLYLLKFNSFSCQIGVILLQIIHRFLLCIHETQDDSTEIRILLRDLPVKTITSLLKQYGINPQFLRTICKVLITLALKGTGLRSKLDSYELIHCLLDCFGKVDHFQSLNACMSCIACLLCCSESSINCHLERFFVISWDKFETHPWRIYVLKAICDLVVSLPDPIPLSRRVAHVLTETARLHGVDKQCGIMAFSAIIACCDKNKGYPILFKESRLIQVLTSAAMSFDDNPVSSLRLHTCVQAVYLREESEITQRLIGEGALTSALQVALLPSEVMRAKWSKTLDALALQR